jgi:hypothetical protein
MPDYTWPVGKWIPSSSVFHIRTMSQLSQSPFTGASKGATSGQLWVCEATFPPMQNRDAYDFGGFLEGLEGPLNPVWMHDWHRPYLRAQEEGLSTYTWTDGSFFTDGTGWADPAWNVSLGVPALAGSRSITINGFPVSQQVLWRGDAIGVGDNLVQVQSNVFSDAAGIAMVPVLPGLRRGVLASTPISTVRPKVRMRLSADTDVGIYRASTLSSEITLRFVEAVDLP